MPESAKSAKIRKKRKGAQKAQRSAKSAKAKHGDIAFLAAMLEDDGLSSLKAITSRTGKSASSTRVYKGRLLEQGIIEEERRGEVRFELPAFREYLKARLTGM